MSKRIKTIITAATICLGASYAQALTIDEAARSVVDTSPLYQASVADMNSQIQALAPAANLANPEVEFEHLWGKVGNKMTIGVNQAFDWPGVYSQRSRVASLQRDEAIATNRLNYLQLQWQSEELLVQAAYQLRALDLLNTISKNFDLLCATYQRSYEMGEGAILDVKKIKIQRLGITSMINENEAQYLQLIGKLRGINPNIDYSQLVSAITLSPGSVPPRESLSYLNDPSVALALAQSQSAQAAIELQRRENLPGFNIGYRYNREIGDNFHGFAAAITLPLWGNRHRVQAASAELSAQQAQLSAAEIRVNAEIDQLWTSSHILQSRLQGYHDVLDDTSIMRLLDMALKGGELTLMEYLQEVDFFVEAQLDMYNTERDLQLDICRLNRYSNTATTVK